MPKPLGRPGSRSVSVYEDLAKHLARAGESGLASIYEDFEKGVGTYLKVIRFPEPPNPDGFVVLYLRPKGFFLFLGYWRGYERSLAAGRWSRHESHVDLEGDGHVSCCSLPNPEAGRFRRTFRCDVRNHMPVLIGTGELTGWSLLSSAGPFTYAGQKTVIDPDGEWLPNSLSDVDAWIDRTMSA